MSWETFKVGDFVVPYRDRAHKESRTIFDGYSTRVEDMPPAEYSGVASEILGITLPYLAVCCIDTRRKFTVDLRRWDMRTCSREYAMLFVEEGKPYIPVKGKPMINTGTKKDKLVGDRCPKCQEPMISFRTEHVDVRYAAWSMRCKKCKIECREYK